jgi:DNA-binding SARP family transcriptional activator/WD40 repeat protein
VVVALPAGPTLLEFRILGPFEVVDDGRALGLGGPKQRALLAVLVLHRGEVVLSDRLIDELWGGRPPATASKTLRVYVSNLRKALGDGVLVTRGSGYVLAPGSDRVDLDRFERLAAEGRDLLERGDAWAARDRLRGALGLWRGSALADFSYEPFAESEIARLEEARLAALEDRIDADLAIGSDGALISELESLVSSNPLQERLRGQLMRALYRAGRQADALMVYRHTRERLRDELGLEPSRMLQDLERSILEQDPRLDVGAARAGSVGVCPFKGLAFFDRADAEYFAGRERLVRDLLARLVESTLVGILGPSGIGKSSLLRAGLLPALSAGALPGSAQWRQVLIRPGEHPCRALQRGLSGDHLGDAVEQLAPGRRIVVAVDHLEELFTVCRGEEERAALLDALIAATRDPERRALVLVSLRADFYGRFAAYPRFAELLSASHVLVSAMDPGELRRAIEQPAARAGLEVERALVDALVSDVAGEPGGLPLLSTALLELWRERDGRVLRYESYRRSGGVHGAVARLAEAAYTRLGESERGVARQVFLRLTSGEDAALARRRVARADLERLHGARPVIAALSDARLLTVSDGEVELSHEALVREWPRYAAWLEEDRIGRRLHAHLMSSAREWEAAGGDEGDLYRGARLAGALEWARQHGDELSPPERRFLNASRHHAEGSARRLRALLAGVVLLLLASLVAGTIALIEQQRATTAARVALARQLGAQAANEPRLDLAMLLAREAVSLDRSPDTEGSLLALIQRYPALVASLELPSDSPPQQLTVSPDGHSLVVGGLGLRFYDMRVHSARGLRLTDLGGARAPVYSADGSLLAYPTSGARSSIEVRDGHTLRLRFRLSLPPVQASGSSPDLQDARVLITPDGTTVYAAYQAFSRADLASESTYLARWSLPSGQFISVTQIDGAGLLAVGLADAGARLVAVDGRTVSVLDARSLRRLSSIAIRPASAGPTVAAISPDGRTVAIASRSGALSFVDAKTGEAHTGTGPDIGPVTDLIYSPSNRAVASAANNEVIIWNPHSHTSSTQLTIPVGQVQPIAFSPDGHTLYTSSIGGLVLEWDLAGVATFGQRLAVTGQSSDDPVAPPTPPLALSSDGTTFAIRLGASTVGLFSARTLQRRGSFSIQPSDADITAFAWSPTARELAIGGRSGLVQLWHTDGTPRLMRSLGGLQPAIGRPEAIQAIQFSPDGRLVAATDASQTSQSAGGSTTSESRHDYVASLALWRTDNGRLSSGLYPLQLGTGPAPFDPLAFSPNSRLVVVGAPDGSDHVVDTMTAQTRQPVLHPGGGQYTRSLAFSSNGTFATGSQGGTVQLWDPISDRRIASPLLVTAGPVSSVAFDSTGRRFVTAASQDGTVKLFATSTLQQEGTALPTDQGSAATATFAPRGDTLLVVNDQGNAFTWPLSLTAWEQRACAIAGRNLTRQEWNRFVPGQSYSRICP